MREKHQQAIVYTNDGFCSLTGYLRSEVVRQDAACEFLTGPLTNEQTLHDLKHAVSHRKEFVDDILLYRADGEYDTGFVVVIKKLLSLCLLFGWCLYWYCWSLRLHCHDL